MMDVTANGMFDAATVKGTIDTIPQVQGLPVWKRRSRRSDEYDAGRDQNEACRTVLDALVTDSVHQLCGGKGK